MENFKVNDQGIWGERVMAYNPLWNGVALGWRYDDEHSGMGICGDKIEAFLEAKNKAKNTDTDGQQDELMQPVLDETDGHVLCVAPTGAGKGRGLILPTLLTYDGSAVVLDIKGEAAKVSARRRREMGQKVYILDPFKELGKTVDGFNPLDMISSKSIDEIEDAAMMYAKMLAGGERSAKEPFWEDQGDDLNAAIIAYVMLHKKGKARALGTAYDILMSDDLERTLRTILHDEEVKSYFIKQKIAAYLDLPERETRPSVTGTARQRMRSLSSQAVRTVTSKTSFSVRDLIKGKPITIYLVIPVNRLESHKGLLRLWLSALVNIITLRKERPEKSTIFVIDEMAQVGHMPQFTQMTTLLRGYGLRAMMILQSVSQLRGLYPDDPETMIQNCGTILTFGHLTYTLSQDMANILGDIGPDALYEMKGCDSAVKHGKGRTEVMRRPDYLEDDVFQGHYDKNVMLGR